MKHTLSETCYQFFSTLANPTRLAILELLRERPRNVTEISEALNQEQSMISHNLKPLERCRFVFSERRKKERLYSLNKETIEQIFKIFAYHAEKYCPTEGKCLTNRSLQNRGIKALRAHHT
jgi:DNA-binding transcriptional ArsR family regulator